MLTGKQKQYLKALAVQLPAVVQIGKDGMSETVIQSVDDVLTARELIKVKINQNSDEDIKSTALYLAGNLSCEIVQIIGRNCVLFKKKEKKSHYELPQDRRSRSDSEEKACGREGRYQLDHL